MKEYVDYFLFMPYSEKSQTYHQIERKLCAKYGRLINLDPTCEIIHRILIIKDQYCKLKLI